MVISAHPRTIGLLPYPSLYWRFLISVFSFFSISSDPLQCGFDKGASTRQCTWTILEVTSYSLRNGSEVFGCFLDFSKAFSKVNFKHLFTKLIARKVPFIFLRLLFIYRRHRCCVKWNSSKSQFFSVNNGVRQGAVVSLTLFCVYLDSLLVSLRNSGLGCHISNLLLGALGYADDIILLAPTRQALQKMLKICEEFACTHSMQFITDPNPTWSKTKCMFFSLKKLGVVSEPVILNGDPLPWVDTAKHLGNELSTKINKELLCPDTSHDLLVKRVIFYNRVYSLSLVSFLLAVSKCMISVSLLKRYVDHINIYWC